MAFLIRASNHAIARSQLLLHVLQDLLYGAGCVAYPWACHTVTCVSRRMTTKRVCR